MTETEYAKELISTLEDIFPGCFILHNDPRRIQGVPDLLVLYQDRWAMLEVKKSADAPVQKNQPYYVELFGSMSYAAFIYPENEEAVLYELQRSFFARR